MASGHYQYANKGYMEAVEVQPGIRDSNEYDYIDPPADPPHVYTELTEPVYLELTDQKGEDKNIGINHLSGEKRCFLWRAY